MPNKIQRIISIDKTLDEFAIALAEQKNLEVCDYYSRLLHLHLDTLHTMKYEDLESGYVQMAKINLELF